MGTEKDSTDIQWGDLRKLGWKWSNDHNGLGNYFYRPGISTKIQKASAVENIDVFKDISDIRSMIQIHNIKNQLLNNQDYLNRYVNYHIQNAVLLINQELDTNAHLSDLQLWNCLASKKGWKYHLSGYYMIPGIKKDTNGQEHVSMFPELKLMMRRL